MQASSSTAAGRAAPSPRTPNQEASTSTLPPQHADLSLFLQSSFDASAYVLSILANVDPYQSAPSSSSLHLQIPASPTTKRKPSISLSPTTPTATKPGASETARTQAQEDIDLSLAISRLNLAIDELDRSISTQVNANAPELLRRTSNLALMQTGVGETKNGLVGLHDEVSRLRSKVHEPFVRVVELQRELKQVDGASELVRRTRGVVELTRRLESQMEALFARKDRQAEAEAEAEDAVVGQVHGRDLSRAALLVAEITALLDAERLVKDGATLLDLKLIQELLPTIDNARKTIVDYMEDMIVRGLRDLSPLMLGSSLQTAFNLGTLPTLTQDLLNDLTEVVKERTAAAFDLESLSQQLKLPLPLPSLDAPAPSYSTYRGRNRVSEDELRHQHQQQQQVWSDGVWKKLESLVVVEMGAVCSKVYLLEKVLKLKSSETTGVNFLDAALEVLGDRPSYTFWLTFAQSLQQQVEQACGRSKWLKQMLSVGVRAGEGYPKLIRLFHEFFAKISVYTDVQYTPMHQSPETVILLKSLGGLEAAYVDKNTASIAEVLSHAVTPHGGGGARKGLVGEDEAETVVRSIANVLDATRFDPLLSRAVVVKCSALVDQCAARIDGAAAKDDSASMLSGEISEETPASAWNASLVRFAYTLSRGLASAAADQDGSPTNTANASAARSTTNLAATPLTAVSQNIAVSTRISLVEPLLKHLNSMLSATMGKMHVQLASTCPSPSSSKPPGKPERGVSIDSTSGASAYASSICQVVSHLGDRLLPLYPAEVRAVIAGSVANRVVELFCLHASIVSLPSSQDEVDRLKLRLATDMTEFEFALSQLVGDRLESVANSAWVVDESHASLVVGGAHDAWTKTIKAFRRLLFLSLDEVEQQGEKETQLDVPVVLVVLQLLSRNTTVLEAVIQEMLVTGAREKGARQGAKSDFVQWIQTMPKEQVWQQLQKSLSNQHLDSQTRRIIEHLIAP